MRFIGLEFLWYDFWVGAFWDRRARFLYICLLPCVVLKFWVKPKPLKIKDDATEGDTSNDD